MQNPRKEEKAAVAMATTKALGKRKTGSTKGDLKCFCSLSLQPEQHGRSICFRTAHSPTRSIDFYCIPVDDDFDDDADGCRTPELYGPPTKRIFPFHVSTKITDSASFAAVGKSMFCVGGHKVNGKGEESSAIYRFDTTGDNAGCWYRNSFDLCCPRVYPTTIAMDGELFVIGSQGDNAPLAEVFDPSSKCSLVLEQTPKSLDECTFFETAALRDRNQILVSCTYVNDAYLLDVKTRVWVKIDPPADFATANREAAAVLKTTLCWYNDRLHKLVAYDLNLKKWFKTSIKNLKKVGRQLKDVYRTDFSLFPLDENHLCFLWADHVTRVLLHCTKVRVSLSDGKFCAAVASSRSYIVRDGSRFLDGLLLDLTSIPQEGSTSRDVGGKN